MKIAIVTLPLGLNYGGIMQNYALQQVLKRLGHSPVTINCVEPRARRLRDYPRFVASALRTIVMRIRGKYRRFVRLRKVSIPTAQAKFMAKHLTLTPSITDYTPFGDIFDAYIAGSDQVWRPAYTTHLRDMFLGFVPPSKARRFSYAASFGVDTWEYTPGQTEMAQDISSRLDAVSVRELSGVDLCREHLGLSAEVVLDPTLLLEKEDYMTLCDESKDGSQYLGTYVIDGHPHRFKAIFDACRSLEMPHKDVDPNVCSITQWLAMFRDAKYIVTDSFHGTVFSIIFRKPFAVLVNNDRGASRFHSLLASLGLEDRIVSGNQNPATILSGEIDWPEVEKRLDVMKSQSIEFLKECLK